MSAPARTKATADLSPGQTERAAQIRELIAAQMYFVGIYGDIVRDLAEAGDDAGISYSLEKLALYTKTALSLRLDLEAIRRERRNRWKRSRSGMPSDERISGWFRNLGNGKAR